MMKLAKYLPYWAKEHVKRTILKKAKSGQLKD